jgi:hypothetical protein
VRHASRDACILADWIGGVRKGWPGRLGERCVCGASLTGRGWGRVFLHVRCGSLETVFRGPPCSASPWSPQQSYRCGPRGLRHCLRSCSAGSCVWGGCVGVWARTLIASACLLLRRARLPYVGDVNTARRNRIESSVSVTQDSQKGAGGWGGVVNKKTRKHIRSAAARAILPSAQVV